VKPAQQRFRAGDASGRQFHLWLVKNDELIALEPCAQAVFEDHALHRAAGQVGR
jgi:hypothetical protein